MSDLVVVIEQETHPDRMIEEVYGPFESYQVASDWATARGASRANRTPGGNRMWNFIVREVSAPESTTLVSI